MNDLFTIGEFSRSTHLSVKALRHYHDVGLLEPSTVDPTTGYRAYSVAQVPAAQVIRRLRDLDMPLDGVRAVLDASSAGDVDERDRLILVHLERMERQLEQTQSSVASLRELLEGSQPDLAVEYRTVAPTAAIAITSLVTWDDAETWLTESLGALDAIVDDHPGTRSGPDSALYPAEFFEAHAGEVTAYIPITGAVVSVGAAALVEVPGARLAVALHRGSFAELDRTYAAVGSLVASRAIGADGPVREHYLDDDVSGADPVSRTEVAWPVSVDT